MRILVRDVMTKKVVTLRREERLPEIMRKLFQFGFDGAPVVDNHGAVLGLVTQYDLVTKSSGLHLPTLERVFENLPVLRRDSRPLKQSFAEINRLAAKDIMNIEPLMVSPDSTIDEAAKIFAEHHRVNPLVVAGPERKLLGVLSRYDIIKLYDPDHFTAVLSGSVGDRASGGNPKIEKETHGLLEAMRKEFVLVSRWRSRFWYITAGLFFVAGFIVAMAWVIRVTIE